MRITCWHSQGAQLRCCSGLADITCATATTCGDIYAKSSASFFPLLIRTQHASQAGRRKVWHRTRQRTRLAASRPAGGAKAAARAAYCVVVWNPIPVGWPSTAAGCAAPATPGTAATPPCPAPAMPPALAAYAVAAYAVAAYAGLGCNAAGTPPLIAPPAYTGTVLPAGREGCGGSSWL